MRIKFIVYKDAGRQWRWNLKAANGRKIATSGEAFDSKSNALRAARAMRSRMHDWQACSIEVWGA